MTGKQKINMDVNFINKAIKSIIETVQSTNKTDIDETSKAENIFNSVYKKVEEVMKNAGTTVENTSEDDLGADNDFLNEISFEKANDNQTEIGKIKTTFKIEEEKLKISFEGELKKLKFSFKEKHENLKQDFQNQIDALKATQA